VGSDRSLVAIAVGVIATVVAAVAIVVIAGERPGAAFPADSPESAVQGYFSAWKDDDLETAYGYFSSRIKSRVPLEQYRSIARDNGFSGAPEQRRVTIDKVEVDDQRAEVYLGIDYSIDIPFPFGGGYRDTRTIHLAREANAWKIDDALVGLDPGPFDAFPPDGFPSESFPPDSFPTESFPPDAFPPESFPPDAFPPDAFPTASPEP
jgi:hypothetical protein